MSLSTAARLRFSTLALAIASTYAVESVREEFNVSPTHAQTLERKNHPQFVLPAADQRDPGQRDQGRKSHAGRQWLSHRSHQHDPTPTA